MTDASLQIGLAVIGLIATLIGALVWMVKRVFERDERTTDRFLSALENTIGKNTEAIQAVTTSVAMMNSNLTTSQLTNHTEHHELLQAIKLLQETMLEGRSDRERIIDAIHHEARIKEFMPPEGK